MNEKIVNYTIRVWVARSCGTAINFLAGSIKPASAGRGK
jgi:hypothetical protein